MLKFALTVTSSGCFTALIPMGEPLAETMARDDDPAGIINSFLASRDSDDPDINPNGEHESATRPIS